MLPSGCLCRHAGIVLLVVFLAGAPLFARVVIVDNTDPPPAFTGDGLWATLTDGAAFGGTYCERPTVPGDPAYYFQWRPDLTAGEYLVSVWYPARSDRPTNAVFTVNYSGGSRDVTIDQTVNGGQWVPLGRFDFPEGQTPAGQVRVFNNSSPYGKYLAADAVRFASVRQLTMVVNLPGGGTTTPAASGTPYDVAETDVIAITATPSVGYAFSHWEVSAGAAVADPYTPATTVTMDVSKTVTAIFEPAGPVNLVMAVSPEADGPAYAVSPPVGDASLRARNEVVNISATRLLADFYFSHWTVSGGSPPANPYAESTTVTMDQDKTVTAVYVRTGTEFRAMWVSRFEWPNSDPVKCRAYIDNVMQKLSANNFNAVVFQMRGQADTLYPSPYEPWSPLISPTGADPGWDPMAYAISKAHENGLEFHAYINAHVAWQGPNPPANPQHLYYKHCNALDPAARDWLVHDASGTPVQYASDNYAWIAPGIPDFQAYWRKQVMYVVEHYGGASADDPQGLQGVHFDRIRTPAATYSHDPISEARSAIGSQANPAGLNFGDWTADQITRTLCDLYAQIMEKKPWIKISSAPLGLYSQDRYPGYPSGYLYGRTKCYQDAQGWLAAGAQDFIVPQIYWADPPYRSTTPHFSEVLPDWVTHSAHRHVYAGQSQTVTGPELVHEIAVTRSMWAYGAQGNCVFSFSNFDANGYWAYYSSAFGAPYAQRAELPDMPWKTNPTTGIIIGNVVGPDGSTPVVDARITRSGSTYTALSSGDGLYSFLLVPPGTYTVTCTEPRYGTRQFVGVEVAAGQVKRVDIHYDGLGPSITQQPQGRTVCEGPEVALVVQAAGDGALAYQWQKNGVNLVDGGQYSGTTTPTLTISPTSAGPSGGIGDSGSYRCVVSSVYGSAASAPAVLTVQPTTCILQNPAGRTVGRGATVKLAVVARGAALTYRWQKNGVNLDDGGHYAGVTAATLTVSPAGSEDAGAYQCVVSGACGGQVTSNAAALAVGPFVWADLDQDGDVDVADFLSFQSCFNGPNRPAKASCAAEADVDADADVDIEDFLRFQPCFNGPNHAPRCK